MNNPAEYPGRAFIKMHGLMNHFVIVDARTESFSPTVSEIERICNPAVGIGADELIVMEPSDRADIFMRIYNADGREVEACGNATRCVAWLLFEEGGVEDSSIETLAGLLECQRAGEQMVRATMGRVSRDWQSIPLSEERDTLHLGIANGRLSDPVAVVVGNPHAVFFVDDLDAVDMLADAPRLQNDKLFPNAANIEAVEVIGPERLRMKVYERGAGLTMACGSGACAAAFAAKARGLVVGNRIDVELPGGTVQIDVSDDDRVVMTGPIAFCFRGEF